MFENLNWWEILVLAVVGLLVFGPERLPKVIADAARMLRTVRTMARNATSELREELGTDIDLQDLNPKNFVRRHLLSEDEEEALRRPLRDAWRDIEEIKHADDVAEAHKSVSADPRDAEPPARSKPTVTAWDSEAT